MPIYIKTSTQIEEMMEANQMVAKTHELLKNHVKPGITTLELDEIAEDFIRSQGGIPSFKGYQGYPKSICISVNHEVIHGIPDNRRLGDGDIVSLDIGVFKNGFHGDAARTLPCGKITDQDLDLIKITEESFFQGLEFAKEGYHLNHISEAIGNFIESKGYSAVRDFTGHGIGRALHEEPQIPNFAQKTRGPKLRRGMTLAIEPMVNAGTYHIRILENDWTVVTIDGKKSAHYENTIAITDGEPIIMTN